MTVENCRQVINESKFPAALKQRLILILPALEKNILSGIYKEASRGDTLLIAESFTAELEKFAKIFTGLKNNDASEKESFWSLFEEKRQLLNEEDKLMFLYLVLDVKSLAMARRNYWNLDELLRLEDFEIDLFEYLPQDEVRFLLQNSLLQLAEKLDFFRGIQYLAVENQWIGEEKFVKDFMDSLSSNQENFTVSKTVGSWISDFSQSSSVPITQRGSLQISDFMVKNTSAAQLSAKEKSFLTSLLKLFLWFSKPEINEADLASYKNEREAQKTANYNKIIGELRGIKKDRPLKSPQAPSPKSAPVLKPISEIRPLGSQVNKLVINNQPKTAQKQPEKPAQPIKLPPVNLPKAAPFPGRPLSIHELLSKNVQNFPKAAGENKQQEIDQKLEELKKKTNVI